MPNGETKFLTVEEVIILNRLTIERHGGTFGILNANLLESAVAMPQQAVYGQQLHPTLETQAGAYLYHLSRNHAFQDGNKRTGFLACEAFLRGNEKTLALTNEYAEELTMLVATGQMSKEQLAEFLKPNIQDLLVRQDEQQAPTQEPEATQSPDIKTKL